MKEYSRKDIWWIARIGPTSESWPNYFDVTILIGTKSTKRQETCTKKNLVVILIYRGENLVDHTSFPSLPIESPFHVKE